MVLHKLLVSLGEFSHFLPDRGETLKLSFFYHFTQRVVVFFLENAIWWEVYLVKFALFVGFCAKYDAGTAGIHHR